MRASSRRLRRSSVDTSMGVSSWSSSKMLEVMSVIRASPICDGCQFRFCGLIYAAARSAGLQWQLSATFNIYASESVIVNTLVSKHLAFDSGFRISARRCKSSRDFDFGSVGLNDGAASLKGRYIE